MRILTKIVLYLFQSLVVVGEGWDYIVFESKTDPKKVIKVMRPLWKQIISRIFLFWRLFEIFHNFSARKKHMMYTSGKIRNLKEFSKMFANPRFIGTTFVQDKVITLRDYLKNSNEKERQDILYKFCIFQEKTWSLGFSDNSFKFSGYGVVNEDIVIIDISELVFGNSEILKVIECRKWLFTLDFQRLNNKEKNILRSIAQNKTFLANS